MEEELRNVIYLKNVGCLQFFYQLQNLPKVFAVFESTHEENWKHFNNVRWNLFAISNIDGCLKRRKWHKCPNTSFTFYLGNPRNWMAIMAMTSPLLCYFVTILGNHNDTNRNPITDQLHYVILFGAITRHSYSINQSRYITSVELPLVKL